MAGVDPTLVTLHAVGRTRLALIECAPSLDLIKNLMKAHPRAALATALGGKFDLSRLDVVFPKAKFWAHAARFLKSLDLPSVRGGLRSTPGPGGLLLSSSVATEGESAIPKAWGTLLPIPDHSLAAIRTIDNRTSRSLVRARSMHVLLGPLSLLPHACDTHATVYPDMGGASSSRPVGSGLRASDFAGAPPFQPSRPTRCCATPIHPLRGRRGHKLTTCHWSALGACLIRLRALPLLLPCKHPRHLPSRPRPRAVLFALLGFAPLG